MQNSGKKFKIGVKDGLPIGLGYFSVSVAFGVQASLAGLPIFISVLISMTNLTSAGQLAGLQIIASCGTILEIILTQLVINSRYFLMSLTLSQKTDESFTLPNRLLCSAGITDEIFAVSSNKNGNVSNKYFLGLMLLPYVGWTLGTLTGALAGNILPSYITSALGIALYAMFIAIIIPPSTTNRGVLCVVILSAGISCLFYYLPLLKPVSSGIATIITALISATIIALIFPKKQKNVQEENENVA